MTIREENKLNMYNSVKTVCDNNQEYWQSIVAFMRAYNQFNEKLAALMPETSMKSQTTVGVTDEKAMKREAMCSQAAQVAAAIYAFADEKNNLSLKADVSYTYAVIMRQRENAVTTVCRNILKHTRTYLADLAEYGVEPATVDALETAIVLYEGIQNKPRTVQAQTKNARQNVNRLIREIDDLLNNRLDKLMEGLQKKHPDFYNQYTTVRRIVDRGGSRSVADTPAALVQ